MKSFRRILVDVDALADRHPAVDRAFELARRCGAMVTLIDVLPGVPKAARGFVNPQVEQELVDDRRDRLDELLRGAAPADRAGDTVAVLRGHPAEAVIDAVIDGHYDLLIRSHGRDAAEPDFAFGPVDKQLLRQCPCPVWVVARTPAGRPRNIVAAIDASPEDRVDADLNVRILQLGAQMRDLEGATLTVVHAWQPYGVSLLESRMGPDAFAGFLADERRQAAEALEQVVSAALPDRAGVTTRLLEGEPERVLPRIITEEGFDLVVMGTVGRTGLAGLVTGNTAERLLHELRGSVLAVKPEGFVAPHRRGHDRK